MPTIEQIRKQFPALERAPDVLLDNAGGSQVPACVAERIRDYMLSTYVQLGADYETSRYSTDTVDRAHAFVELLVNAGDRGRVILGPSTTALCLMLADCYARARPRGRDEIIIAESAHEANAGPWAHLADRGFTVRTWPLDVDSLRMRVEDLRPLLSERTLMVAFPHVSNVLGRIEEARAITDAAHEAGARVIIDGVAYAPHRAIDVAALDADWYVYSTYKVYGPHMAALFGTHEAIGELEGPNHDFIPRDDVPYKFEPGGVSHEGCAGILALWPYLAFLAGADPDTEPTRATVEQAFETIARHERTLQARFIEQITDLPGVRIIGPPARDPARVSTVSFAHASRTSREIALAANDRRLGIRYGHFYAYRLCLRLVEAGLLHDVEDGVVRTSVLHYNTDDEIDRTAAFLADLLG